MRVLIAGGGTAGHINPGIAIAKYIKQKSPDAEILFIGTKRGLETKLVPREGFDLELIRVRGFRRKLSLDTFVAVKELFLGLMEAKRVIRRFKPDVVIGTGGYVCGPVLFNASRMKIPTLIHEQNAFPGVTNRLLARFVDSVAISFKESKAYFKSGEKLVLTGNPIRNELLGIDKEAAKKVIGVSKDKPLVVIMGGSLGAEKINETVVEMVLKYYKEEDCNVIFSTGNNQFEHIKKQLEDKTLASFNIVPYIYDAANVYSAADLVVCRAGAITCSEMTALGVPSIMIPSPNVTANHQEHNARALEQQGAAVVIVEKDLNASLLYQQMMSLLKDREQLGKMGRNAKKAGITNAAEKIYSILHDVMKKRKAV